MLSARNAVRTLPTYHPPLSGRVGMRLDFNENTVGCSPRVLQRLRELDAEQIARYPEREPVEAIAADFFRIKGEELLLTNGIDEAIHLLCETYLEPDDQAIIVVPTFSMYEISATATGAQVVKVPAAIDFRFPLDSVLGAINSRTRLIAVANPNNPTGSAADADELLQVARRAHDAAVLVDEAYFEFCGETLLRAWSEVRNLFVARTFSKAYGMAGMRVGVLCGDAAQIAMVRKVASPYNVNGIALACLPEALADQEYVDAYVRQVCAGRQRLEQELHTLGIEYWPSRANFVLARLGPACSAFIAAVRARGILLRDRSSDAGCTGCVRMTLGTLQQTEQLLAALREAVKEIGVAEAARLVTR
ncbi:MAG: histidinol-phosphate transaminase [Acidobacteria bacterium]|nr:histidinol-phosphate transaminase [Acidobacteriota bacterium]